MCRETHLTAVVMTVPTVHSNPGVVELMMGRSCREAWRVTFEADEALDATPFNLTLAQPVICRNNILLIGAIVPCN